ncbi:hypothetical protein [Dyella sp. C11]|uniref:hypothetical protein n=1 Tax=Dyella sp. C11 TaxID=2126991 RepID=UPI000D651EBB|nr:hypothetical protein [Dyella sp. C11]
MRASFRSLQPTMLSVFVAMTLLTACGKHQGDEEGGAQGNGQPDAAAQAREDAASTAKCEDNPLAQSLPPKETVGGLPFLLRDCASDSIRAVYGTHGGRQIEISMTDTSPPPAAGDQAAQQDLNRRTRDMQRSTSRAAIEMLTAMTDPMQTSADALAAIGGPDYAPILVPTATKDSFIVHVTAKTQVGPAEALALFKDRYMVTLQASDNGSALTGLTTPQAQALYLPFIQAFHPERLP